MTRRHRADIERWQEIKHLSMPRERALVHLLEHYPAFPSQFYFRLGTPASVLVARIVPTIPTLFFRMSPADVGPGLFVQQEFATIVSARRIGARGWINHQVKIGYTSDDDCPTIGDDVRVAAGAQALGDVRVGNRVTVAANATVVGDIPDDVAVAGVPARIPHRRVTVRA